MLRGYRGVVFTAVGWISLCGAHPPAQQSAGPQSTEQPSPAAQSPATPTPTPSASQTPKFTPYPGYDPDPCYNAGDKDAADLCAQWRAALAAEKAAHEARRANFFAIIAAALGLATVIGLIVTINQTRGALGEARRGNRLNLAFEKRARREARRAAADQARAFEIADRNAIAAEEQVKIARNTAFWQLRPYISFQNIHYSIDLDKDGVKCLFVHIIFENKGVMPARLVSSWGGVDYFQDKEAIRFSPVDCNPGATIAKDQDRSCGVRGISQEELSMRLNNGFIPVFFVAMFYSSNLSDDRHTEQFGYRMEDVRNIGELFSRPIGIVPKGDTLRYFRMRNHAPLARST